jgi:quinolinate synthase
LLKFRKENPEYKIITYINSSAEVKTISDIICTSGNAEKIVNSFDKNEKIMFVPDKNLGRYINNKTGRNMLLWNGTCKIHDLLKAENVLKLKQQHSEAKIIAHPECNAAILKIADFVGSTAAMLKYIQEDDNESYIVATESGIIHQMKKKCKEKKFIHVALDNTCSCNDCEYMKLNTLEKLYLSLKEEKHEIELDKKIISQAKKPIKKMLEIS